MIEVSTDDFQRRACNAISPEPGRIVFTEPVSETLRVELKRSGVNSTALHGFVPGREFGIHCLTLELPPRLPRLPKHEL